MNPNCCHKPDCQDVDCPGRYADMQPPSELDKADKEDALLLSALVGMFIGFIVWSLT